MDTVPRNQSQFVEETRLAYQHACSVLGYKRASHEFDEIIDYLGVMEDGTRAGRLAPFYPLAITEAIDRAARLAREYPEALLSAGDRDLLDLLMRQGVS